MLFHRLDIPDIGVHEQVKTDLSIKFQCLLFMPVQIKGVILSGFKEIALIPLESKQSLGDQ